MQQYNSNSATEKPVRLLTTDEFSKEEGVKPATVRSRYCITGSYFGVKPIKHANGRLRWPSNG